MLNKLIRAARRARPIVSGYAEERDIVRAATCGEEDLSRWAFICMSARELWYRRDQLFCDHVLKSNRIVIGGCHVGNVFSCSKCSVLMGGEGEY